jgi:hypothetical protein
LLLGTFESDAVRAAAAELKSEQFARAASKAVTYLGYTAYAAELGEMSEEAEWDTSKENFVPVRQGRPTSALVTPLSVKKRDQELEDTKRWFLVQQQAVLTGVSAVPHSIAVWLMQLAFDLMVLLCCVCMQCFLDRN